MTYDKLDEKQAREPIRLQTRMQSPRPSPTISRRESLPIRAIKKLKNLHNINSWKEWALFVITSTIVLCFTLLVAINNAQKLGQRGIRNKLNIIKEGDEYQHFKMTFCQSPSSLLLNEYSPVSCPLPNVTYLNSHNYFQQIQYVNFTSSLGARDYLRCWTIDPWWILPNRRNDDIVATLEFRIDWAANDYVLGSSYFSTCFNFLFTFYNREEDRNEILGHDDLRANSRLLTRVSLTSRFYRLMPLTTLMPKGDTRFTPVVEEIARHHSPEAEQFCSLSEYVYALSPETNSNQTTFKRDHSDTILTKSSVVCNAQRVKARNTFYLSNSDLELEIGGFEEYQVYGGLDYIKDLAFIINFAFFAFTRVFTTTIMVPLHLCCGPEARNIRKGVLAAVDDAAEF
mmetsp:Transcript_35469/g.57001  ORF Transcript_35469/g.57001 Transcript_35469/m.57001 type:complete len:399 (+) Transcript_35469:159-1355(+)